jgi:transcriptional repressor NrdR
VACSARAKDGPSARTSWPSWPRARGLGEVPSHEVGLAILGPLRDLDEVAYLRFASVYRGFESLADFEDEIATLRQGREEPAS